MYSLEAGFYYQATTVRINFMPETYNDYSSAFNSIMLGEMSRIFLDTAFYYIIQCNISIRVCIFERTVLLLNRNSVLI